MNHEDTKIRKEISNLLELIKNIDMDKGYKPYCYGAIRKALDSIDYADEVLSAM